MSRRAGFTGGGHGGAITIQACCDLQIGDTGQRPQPWAGPWPGPGSPARMRGNDLWSGRVTGSGAPEPQAELHASPAAGQAGNSTACVEIWSGTTMVIDSTGTHFGEITADTATSGGIQGHGWIDILANGDITIIDGTNDDPGILDGFATDHAVHANQYLGNGRGGDIQVLSKAGKVSTSVTRSRPATPQRRPWRHGEGRGRRSRYPGRGRPFRHRVDSGGRDNGGRRQQGRRHDQRPLFQWRLERRGGRRAQRDRRSSSG